MRIEPFEIERFYERWEFRAELMLSSSDCESRTVQSLLDLEPDARERLLGLRLGYTEVPGSQELRDAVASTYDLAGPDDVLSLAAAEEGIFIAYHVLLAPGDHAIVESPCYGSAATAARSTGAEVSLWERRHEDGWAHDLDALAALVRPNTKLIYINTPHNPTGTQMSPATYEAVLDLAREREIVVFGDEVYRGLEHDEGSVLPGACDAYERGISLGTVSKSYGLPGLRVGWLVCRDPDLLRRIRELKLYTSICSPAPSELLVALALRHTAKLVGASRSLALSNLPHLAAFIERRAQAFDWVAPTAGPICFPRVLADVEVGGWCERIATEAGVLVLPGTVYERPRHVRFGFGRAGIAEAIARLEGWLDGPGSSVAGEV